MFDTLQPIAAFVKAGYDRPKRQNLVKRTMGVGLLNDLPKRGDPTVVPEKPFGSITVSCGARPAQQELEDAQPRIEGEGKPSPAIREGR